MSKEKLICLKCGYAWESRVRHPASCPRCKSYTWDKPRKERGFNEVLEEEVK